MIVCVKEQEHAWVSGTRAHPQLWSWKEMPGGAEGYPAPVAASMHRTARAYPQHTHSGTESGIIMANRETRRATVFA